VSSRRAPARGARATRVVPRRGVSVVPPLPAVAAPETAVPEPDEERTWQRIVGDGKQQAAELWERARNSAANAREWCGTRPVYRVLFSDILASPKRNFFVDRPWGSVDITYSTFIGAMHVGALLAPFAFQWTSFYAFLAMYFVTGCLGITLSYHRQLSHRSFKTPKWLEYVLAYCGVLALQGDPLEWASSHRYHHLHCDTPKDPHTPYEGFWWSHAGWLLDNEATLERVGDRSNANDMAKQPYYTWLKDTYSWHAFGSGLATFVAGLAVGGDLFSGVSMFLWAFCFRAVWVYHITWAVNSVAHVWGTQEWNTGDLSRNNWPVGILAFGEGWHNNHHAFEFSARHGLKWWQFDPTWYIIAALKAVGLATAVKLPSQGQMDRLRLT